MNFKFQSLAYLFIAGLIGFTSCKKDDENVPAPTFTFTSGGASMASFNSGETVDFTSVLSSDEDYTGFKATLTYTKAGGTSASTITVKDANNSNKEINYTMNSDIETSYDGTNIIKVVLPADAIRGIEWTITATASTSGGTTTATFKGSVVNLFTTKLVGAQLSAQPSFLSSSDGSTYGASAAVTNVAKVDIGFAFGDFGPSAASTSLISYKLATVANGFATPAPASATDTKYVSTTLVPADFLNESASWKEKVSSINFSTATNYTSVAKGQVYAFLNAAGKRGIIHVADITGTGLNSEATLDVKAEN